jgi:Zn-dependent M28 family amino/carboxypeptidase
MKSIFSSILIFFFLSLSVSGQVPEKNPVIEEMVSSISKDSLEANIRKLVSFGTRHSLSGTESDTRGIGAARRWVLSRFQAYAASSGGRMEASLDPFVVEKGRRIPYDVEMKNVMAILKGVDPQDDRTFVISGHLDSRVTDVMDSTSDAPGANDDASGVALVMELARVMAKQEFPSTIIFVAVQGEEQGLLGAAHLASSLKADSANVVAMFNNDMVGNTQASEVDRNSDDRMRIFSETIPNYETEQMSRMRSYTGAENDSQSRQLARYIKAASEAYVQGFTVTLNYRVDRYLRGGDHIPFTREGFTAVRFCEFNENYKYQHQDVREENGEQYGDLPEYVNYDYVHKIARVNLASLSSLALAPYAPENVGLKVSLGNISQLSWETPTKGEAPEGYYVLYRETSSPTWEGKVFVKDTSAELPYSKDNYYFGVQSVDKEGNASLPVFPAPAR